VYSAAFSKLIFRLHKRRQGVVYFSAVLLTLVLITGLLRYYFHDGPPASFADLYLFGVLVLAYHSSWKLAAALAGASLLLGAYVLNPLDGVDRFHLASFAACAIVIVFVTAALQRRRA
jgi:hypothetical protein